MYVITPLGKDIVADEVTRLAELIKNGKKIIEENKI